MKVTPFYFGFYICVQIFIRTEQVIKVFSFCLYGPLKGQGHLTKIQSKILPASGVVIHTRFDEKSTKTFVNVGWGYLGENLLTFVHCFGLWQCQAFVNIVLCLLYKLMSIYCRFILVSEQNKEKIFARNFVWWAHKMPTNCWLTTNQNQLMKFFFYILTSLKTFKAFVHIETSAYT